MGNTESGDGRNPLPGRLRERRTALRISKAEAARRAGVGRMTWWEWEEGRRRPYDSNYAGIEDAMQWPAGTVQSLVATGRSSPTENPAPVESDDDGFEWSVKDDQLYETIRSFLAEYGLTPTQEDIERMREENRRLSIENAAEDGRGDSATAS